MKDRLRGLDRQLGHLTQPSMERRDGQGSSVLMYLCLLWKLLQGQPDHVNSQPLMECQSPPAGHLVFSFKVRIFTSTLFLRSTKSTNKEHLKFHLWFILDISTTCHELFEFRQLFTFQCATHTQAYIHHVNISVVVSKSWGGDYLSSKDSQQCVHSIDNYLSDHVKTIFKT